ncbi:MAG: penicillin-binding protein 2 [Gammaproteobacteria bacterium]|nr:penicillin-binding protein 2 [Gammaproteobacteria bacterium]
MVSRVWLIKDPVRERRLFRFRSILAAVAAVVITSILILRLYFLQVTNHEHYSTLSANNRLTLQPIAPTRGMIFDRQGVVIAENVPSFTLEIVREQVSDMEITLEVLSSLITISDGDIERFKREMGRKRRFDSVPLRFKLTDEEVAIIAVNSHHLPGVEVHSRLIRHYPFGQLTAHTLGYVGRISEQELSRIDPTNYAATTHIGKLGVEKSHEALLHGEVGMQQVETNARGRVIRVIERIEPSPGKNLYLNIDLTLHQRALTALGDERGAVVAIDPNNGAVLALVSNPGYDSNLFVNGISYSDYNTLTSSPSKPLFNRALKGQYPPGSTVKPFIGLAGLEFSVITPRLKTFCPGWYQLEGSDHRYRDWNRWGHGATTLHDAIVQSCDVFFYDLSLKLGIDHISDYMHQFGFGTSSAIDIGGDVPGLVPSREWKKTAKNEGWFPGETLNTGIGQGFFLATPIQLANAVATLANSGIRYQPQVVRAVETQSKEGYRLLPGQRAQPTTGISPLTPLNLQRIQEAMIAVIHSDQGTARRISHGIHYTIAGKTGTSQVFGLGQDEKYVAADLEKRLRDHALFIAYAPADAPQIAVAVIVENGGGGGSTAAPVAAEVIQAYLNPMTERDAP